MKMTIRATGDIRKMSAQIQAKHRRLEEIVADSAETGERMARANIATRGTPKSGKRGRIETGNMHASVKKDIKRSSRRIVSRFGWIDNPVEYFGFQEGGFRHIGGSTVPAMYAVTDAGHYVFKAVKMQIGEVMRNG